jgi:hypothetical protein
VRFRSRWRDSNPRPAHYKCAALPAELHRRCARLYNLIHESEVVKGRLEDSPTSSGIRQPWSRRRGVTIAELTLPLLEEEQRPRMLSRLDLPLQCSSISVSTARRSERPRPVALVDRRRSCAWPRSSCLNHSPRGTPKPHLGLSRKPAGIRGRIISFRMCFAVVPRSFIATGMRLASPTTLRSRRGCFAAQGSSSREDTLAEAPHFRALRPPPYPAPVVPFRDGP